MLNIQKAIKKIIERFIVNMLPLSSPATAGDTTVTVESTRRFCAGEGIVIYNKPDPEIKAEGEVHTIENVLDRNTLQLDAPLISSYPLANSYVEKLIGFESGNQQFLEAVYIGEPAVIPRYPAITVNAKGRSSEWLTLESTSESYEIEISVYVTAADYESQYELMHAYVKSIESSLFRSFFPLVEPYEVTTLAQDVNPSDTFIQVTDNDFFNCPTLGWIWFENIDYTRPNRIKRFVAPNVYELQFATGSNFYRGDQVIRPHRHIYNTLPHSTQYGTINKDTMIQAAVISYKAQEEIRRYTPYIDPLNQ